MTKRGIDEETGEFLGPSRGEERRAALAVLELAARMVEQPMARLMQMPVSDDMLSHIATAQKISAQIARKRQIQYVAKQMRKEEAETLESWRALLDFDRQDVRREIAEAHRIEQRPARGGYLQHPHIIERALTLGVVRQVLHAVFPVVEARAAVLDDLHRPPGIEDRQLEGSIPPLQISLGGEQALDHPTPEPKG